MKTYPLHVYPDVLISPINGYQCRIITDGNITNVGFDTINDLLDVYPDFPLICQEHKDALIHAGQIGSRALSQKHQNIRDAYVTSPCDHCGGEMPWAKRNNRFCNRSCSASFTNKQRKPRSQDSRNRTSRSVKTAIDGTAPEELYRRKKVSAIHSASRKLIIVDKSCVICSTIFTPSNRNAVRQTCSTECQRTLAQNNALKQKVHGGGKKGRYRGFHCDSTYELAYLIYHLDHNIPITRCDEIRDYIYREKNCKYQPDFIVGGEIIEIKGYMSNRARAKLDQNTDIVLIDSTDIKPYITYVIDTYNVKCVSELYE
jgi:hypothetical protein